MGSHGNPGSDLRVMAFCDYFGADTGGGAEAVAANVFGRLAGRGFDILVVGASPTGPGPQTRTDGIATAMVRGRDLSRLVGGQFMVAPGLGRAARAVLDGFRPDVIHASSIHFLSSRVAARLARRTGVPLVTTAHVGPIDHLPAPTRWVAAGYERTFGRSILRSSRRVIAVSQTVADHVTRLGARSVDVVPNGVDPTRFTAAERHAGRNREIVFVGRLIGNKGPDIALEAFLGLRHPDVRLTFAGGGPMRSRLERRAAAAGRSDSIRFLGHVDDVAPVMNTADILVRPSQTEGQSLAILEGMAAGACVVASDIWANRELITPGANGLLVPPDDAVALRAALASLLDDPSKRDELARNGRLGVARHSWDACAASTATILRQAASA